jgi:hypothetical protein
LEMGREILNVVLLKKLWEICFFRFCEVIRLMKNNLPLISAVAYYYFFSSQVRRSIVYGDQPRNRYLNLFLLFFHNL